LGHGLGFSDFEWAASVCNVFDDLLAAKLGWRGVTRRRKRQARGVQEPALGGAFWGAKRPLRKDVPLYKGDILSRARIQNPESTPDHFGIPFA